MAIRPCSICHERFLGPANSTYVAILDGNTRWESKQKLCAKCFRALLEQFGRVDGLIDYDEAAVYKQQPCFVCLQETNERRPQSVFMTAYPAKEDRRDYFAPCCTGCRPTAEMALTLQ